jgi:hypothetical protein
VEAIGLKRDFKDAVTGAVPAATERPDEDAIRPRHITNHQAHEG